MEKQPTLYERLIDEWAKSSKGNHPQNSVIYETTTVGERAYDVFSRLMKERIVVFDTEVNPATASEFKATLLCLDAMDYKGEKHADITVYIDSPGGSVYSLFGMYDTMQYVKSDIKTICTGFAASAASVLLTAGTKGKRYVLPHSTVMIHQPRIQGMGGPITDVEITTEHLKKNKKKLIEIYVKHTGQPFDKLASDIERDCWMDAEEAVKYGLADGIIKELPKFEMREK